MATRGQIDPCKVLLIGIQIIDALKAVHDLGYIHNDIRPANIMLNFVHKLIEDDDGWDTARARQYVVSEPEATLINFRLNQKYVIKSLDQFIHIEQMKVTNFKGNILYSSSNAMNLWRTSRRDDIISVSYMILTLLNKCKFPC